MFQNLTVALTYLTVGLAAAIFCHFVLRRRVLGNFWAALVVGLIGAVFGGILDQVLAGEIERPVERMAHFNSVNLFAAGFCAIALIWTLSRLNE